jgi:hypothetical protein
MFEHTLGRSLGMDYVRSAKGPIDAVYVKAGRYERSRSRARA